MSTDERILYLLGFGPSGSRALAESLGCSDRTIRRRLQRLIRGGYVFSPIRGLYRLTQLGRAVMEEEATPPRVGRAVSEQLEDAPPHPLRHWVGGR